MTPDKKVCRICGDVFRKPPHASWKQWDRRATCSASCGNQRPVTEAFWPKVAVMAEVNGHPGKTPAQRRVLDEIGCGNYSPCASKRTIDALLKQGLITEMSPRLVSFGGLGMMKIREFQMPLHIHLEWCLSCGDEEEPPAQAIDARSGQTEGLDPKGESAVAESDAPLPPLTPSQGDEG